MSVQKLEEFSTVSLGVVSDRTGTTPLMAWGLEERLQHCPPQSRWPASLVASIQVLYSPWHERVCPECA